MSKDYEFVVEGHPSIYQESSRKLKIYFNEPDEGVNQETGIALLIPGFGGNANSKVYKKMRSLFADTFNLLTVQCDYFGWEFMQSNIDISKLLFNQNNLNEIFTQDELQELLQNETIDGNKLLEISKEKKCILKCRMMLEEDLTNFNDMGIMQAIDNITAVLIVIDILKQNRLDFNQGKIMAYGHSHGSYLAYLSNALAPFLFSHIIDNSSWLKPEYVFDNRTGIGYMNNVQCNIEYEYLARKIPHDLDMISLPLLYKKFENKSMIISYHGVNDGIISHLDKRNFFNEIDNYLYYEISSHHVDGVMIKSTNHGLDADFIKLFDHAHKLISEQFMRTNKIMAETIRYQTEKFLYEIDYSCGRPLVKISNP